MSEGSNYSSLENEKPDLDLVYSLNKPTDENTEQVCMHPRISRKQGCFVRLLQTGAPALEPTFRSLVPQPTE